jgi:hypothetical protein
MNRRRFTALLGMIVALACGRSALGLNILMLTNNSGSLTSVESTLKSRLEAAGWVVNTLWDGDTQANYTAAYADNDVVYIPSDVSTTDMANKLRDCPIGVINEIAGYMDDLGLCTAAGSTTFTSSVSISNNTHYITNSFVTGAFTLGSTSYNVAQRGGTTASGATALATAGGINSIIVVDTGGTLANTINSNSTAAGRRAQMPVQLGVVDTSTFTYNFNILIWKLVLWTASFEGDLEAQWKLNETFGTSAADSTGNGRTGTVTGTSSWVSAVLNNGFSFNGATKIQATGLMNSPRNVSVAAWANLTAADSVGAEIISLGDHFFLRLDDSGVAKAAFYNGSAYVTVTFSATFAGTGWHHFAATFDDPHDSLKLYIDGTLVATTSTTSSISYAGLGTNTVIGRQGNALTTSDFTGTLDEVRVYSYVLSSTDVAQLYGLIGRWKLNESSGTTATDSTIFNRDGTLTGTASWSSDCGGMGVFDFNGGTDLFTVANAADFQPTTMLSISAWIKGDSWGSGSSANAILRKGDANPNNYSLQVSDGRVELLLDGTDAGGIRGNTVLNTGQWYHVAATWDGVTAKIYVNGVLDNSPGTARAAPIATDTRPLYLGGRAGADYFDGMIRDVRIYNRPLTAAELVQGAGLVGWWKFAEGSGTSAADSSGMGNNATLSGGASWTSDCAGNNNALLTNGTGGIAATNAAFTPPDAGTVAFWMRSTGAPAGTARIMGLGGDWELRQQTDGTVITDLCGDGGSTICTVTPLTTVGRWYHVAFTFDSANDSYAIYVDGVLERSGTNSVNMLQQAAAVLSFGTRTGSTEYWSGALRDVRIYNRKLCPTEIAALYGLVGYWKLNEASGTVASDSSGLGHSGTVTGTVNWVAAKASNGFQFDYTNGYDYITLPNTTTLDNVQEGDYTLAAWFKPLSTPPGTGSANNANYAILLKAGFHCGLSYSHNQQFEFGHYLTGNVWHGTGTWSNSYPPGSWHHVVAVVNRTAGTITLYLDNVVKGTDSFTPNTAAREFGAQPWNIGIADPNYSTWGWAAHGIADDVRIYSRALCPAEVQDVYQSGNPFGGVKITKWVEIQ